MDNAQIIYESNIQSIGQHEVVSLVDKIIFKAIELNVSDIHIEPLKETLRIRFRIDGLLTNEILFNNQLIDEIISRIKVISNLNVAERRFAQDGKFSLYIKNNNIDFRVSIFPTINGEKAVIRILDRNNNLLKLNALGFEPNILENLTDLAKSSSGFFLVTGPTGSGKTTTLHAILNYINSIDKNICTLENPVEYCVDGIIQSQVNYETGFTFELGIRALLRQDPDIIMVGEIRDYETARISINAALTGHFVLSTLHTNDSIGAIMRLLDMKVESFLINSALTGVLAQRLVRKLCEQCKFKSNLSKEESELASKLHLDIDYTFKASGCEHCHKIGYKGRVGIFELLLISTELRALITREPNIKKIYNQAISDGLQTLLVDATIKIKNGVTSLSEIIRVII